MDINPDQETIRYPGTELPGEAGLYKRFAKHPETGEEVMNYCLFEEGFWYEGSPVSSSALNKPMRKSRFQAGNEFEWCGVMPGAYERPDMLEAKAVNFSAGFFEPNPELQRIQVRVVPAIELPELPAGCGIDPENPRRLLCLPELLDSVIALLRPLGALKDYPPFSAENPEPGSAASAEGQAAMANVALGPPPFNPEVTTTGEQADKQAATTAAISEFANDFWKKRK